MWDYLQSTITDIMVKADTEISGFIPVAPTWWTTPAWGNLCTLLPLTGIIASIGILIAGIIASIGLRVAQIVIRTMTVTAVEV